MSVGRSWEGGQEEAWWRAPLHVASLLGVYVGAREWSVHALVAALDARSCRAEAAVASSKAELKTKRPLAISVVVEARLRGVHVDGRGHGRGDPGAGLLLPQLLVEPRRRGASVALASGMRCFDELELLGRRRAPVWRVVRGSIALPHVRRVRPSTLRRRGRRRWPIALLPDWPSTIHWLRRLLGILSILAAQLDLCGRMHRFVKPASRGGFLRVNAREDLEVRRHRGACACCAGGGRSCFRTMSLQKTCEIPLWYALWHASK